MLLVDKPQATPPNLTKTERQALTELMNDKDILIKPADMI